VLDDKFRTVLVLVDVEGLDYETAAEAAGAPLGTVKSRLARARERVQECLQDFWELLPDLFRLNDEETAILIEFIIGGDEGFLGSVPGSAMLPHDPVSDVIRHILVMEDQTVKGVQFTFECILNQCLFIH